MVVSHLDLLSEILASLPVHGLFHIGYKLRRDVDQSQIVAVIVKDCCLQEAPFCLCALLPAAACEISPTLSQRTCSLEVL